MFFDQPTIARPNEVVGIEPGNSNQFSYLNYRDLKDAAIFESVFGYRRTELSLRTGDMTQSVPGLAVSGNFFDGLGVRAQFGRMFTDAEAAPERDAPRRRREPRDSGAARSTPIPMRSDVCSISTAAPYTLLGVLAARLSARSRRSSHRICTCRSTCSARQTFRSGETTTRSPSWQGFVPAWASIRRDRS